MSYTETLKSKRVLVEEILHSAQVAHNQKHIDILENDLRQIDNMLKFSDNPTVMQRAQIQEWLGEIEHD